MSLGSYTFDLCKSLEYVICLPVTPPTTSYAPFYYVGAFYVPDGSLDKYKTAVGWKDFAAKIFPMSQFLSDFPEEEVWW